MKFPDFFKSYEIVQAKIQSNNFFMYKVES